MEDSNVLTFLEKKNSKMITNYIIGETLGQGNFGKVKEAIHSESLRRVAIKIFDVLKISKANKEGIRNINKEISLLKRIKHINVIQLLYATHNQKKTKIYMITEYCPKTLQDLVDHTRYGFLPEQEVRGYYEQIIIGLEYLHNHNIVHRDIKPENLLLSRDGIVKIVDFGTALVLDLYSEDDIFTSVAGSPAFQPPEVASASSQFHGFKLDIWASGITLFRLVTGEYPFDGETLYQLYENVTKCEYKIPNFISNSLSSLMKGILTRNISDRFSISQIKNHSWMNQIFCSRDLTL